jgi:acetylornithine deacetylase
MMRLELAGRPAHAARRWRGEDVLPLFERIRTAFSDLEAERAGRVSHPLYGEFDVPWPTVIGRVEAGNWASNVAGHLSAEMRLGVAPGETVESVEAEYRDRLDEVVRADEWLRAHPPSFERFGVQFEPAEVDPGEPVVVSLQDAMEAQGLSDTHPRGETYGADSRFYVEAGVPTVVFGPGHIEEAHFPGESIHWPDVVTATEVLADAVRRLLTW